MPKTPTCLRQVAGKRATADTRMDHVSCECYDQLCLLGNVGQTGFQSNGSDHADQVSREEQSGQVEVRLQLVSGLYIFGR